MAFKDLFIKSDEVIQPQTQDVKEPQVLSSQRSYVSQPTQTVNNVMASTPINISSPQPNVSSRASISADETIVNKIWDKIIAANRPGPDYLELKNNVDALDDLPISNEQKLISAFKVLKKSYPNFQKDDITKAIDFYMKIVNDEKESGLRELDSLIAENVSGVENEIASSQAKLEELKQQYDNLQSTIAEKTLELAKSKSDLDMKHNTFICSIDAVMNVLSNDKNNIMSINF